LTERPEFSYLKISSWICLNGFFFLLNWLVWFHFWFFFDRTTRITIKNNVNVCIPFNYFQINQWVLRCSFIIQKNYCSL
jgi:hypothetical protein